LKNNKKTETRGRKRKLNPIEEMIVYEQKTAGKISIAEIAYKNEISTKTVERITKRIHEELNNQ